MKTVLFYILIFCFFITGTFESFAQYQEEVHNCAANAGDDAQYLKEFIVVLDGANNNQRPPVFRQNLALRKNVTYRFSICNMENSEGEAILRLYDNANLTLSSYYPESQKIYNTINFKCKKSGVYTIMISFKDGKPGKAVGILSYVEK